MFADRIKELRKKNNLTQKEFAARIGVSHTTLVSYEKTGKVPAYDILVKISSEFSVSLDWLCETTVCASGSKDHTAADAARLILELKSMLGSALIHVRESRVEIYLAGVTNALGNFFFAYNKMEELHESKMIDDDIFDSWLDANIAKLENTLLASNK